jgi:hypothetical protein
MLKTKPSWVGLLCSNVFLVAALSAIDGCSSDDDSSSGGGVGQTCETSQDCPLWACTCNDGTSVSIASCGNNRCRDGQAACGSMCDSNGGVSSVREKPTVKDSAECAAFCAKAASLGCSDEPRCDRHFYCDIDEDECAEGKRAYLRCAVETGEWACSGSTGWTLTSSCPLARCETDAGAD